MYRHLLVPLDGSTTAESALPASASLADAFGASVTLFHVIESRPPDAIHGERHLGNPEEAHAYLDEVARQNFGADLHVEKRVGRLAEPDVASAILDAAADADADLIVLCTHGRGALRHRFFGSIAQRIVSRGAVPVLLVPPASGPGARAFSCRRLLVPLDGSPAHEAGLREALQLARACEASLHVLVVVPTLATLQGEPAATGLLLPRTTRAVLELAEGSAEEYLRRQLDRLEGSGVEVTAEVARGEATGTIVETAKRVGADLIVLGSHGRGGMDAFWSGSVTPRVATRVRIPLLLAPVTGEG